MHYVIRASDLENGRYTIAKFQPDRWSRPIEVYHLVPSKGWCSCPSYRQPCKHQKVLDRWLALKCPIGHFYDDELDDFFEAFDPTILAANEGT